MNQEDYNKEVNDKLKEMKDAYRTVFTGPAGWLVFCDLIKEMDFWRPSAFPNDSITTAYNDGKRLMALHIIQRLKESGVIKNEMDLLKPIFMPNIGQPKS
jgi:hypothetical protein